VPFAAARGAAQHALCGLNLREQIITTASQRAHADGGRVTPAIAMLAARGAAREDLLGRNTRQCYTQASAAILALTDASRLGKCRLGRRMLLGCCSQLTALPGIGCYHY